MSNKEITYVMIKNGDISINKTNNIKRVFKKEFDEGRFDSRDWLFKEDLDIRVFVENESVFTKPETLYFYVDNEIEEIFYGTVIFTRLTEKSFETLTDEKLSLIINSIKLTDNNKFVIFN